MIAVIADDFTGAAELAGIGLSHGLSVQLFTNSIEAANADLIIVSSDSRSLGKTDALAVTRRVIQDLLPLQPSLIYKKTDSVLRGYVLDELKEQMKLQGLDKALLLPANPSLNRTIHNGNYYIHNVLISETGFATDPEFGIRNAAVLSMLKADTYNEISILKHEDNLRHKGIMVGEVSSKEDIKNWLQKWNNQFLLAGAGDCFDALLQQLHFTPKSQEDVELLQPHLYVSGTSFSKSVALVKEIQERSGCVFYLSEAILQHGDDEVWYEEVALSVQQLQKAVIAIDEVIVQSANITAPALRTVMAKVISHIVRQHRIKELLIEGGSTAAAIMEVLGIHQFVPVHQLARGVIRMKSDDIFITVKPGSYDLPEKIKSLYLQ